MKGRGVFILFVSSLFAVATVFDAQDVAAQPRPSASPSASPSSCPSRITLRASDIPLGTVLNQIARSARMALVTEKEVDVNKLISPPPLDDLLLPTALAVVLTPLGYGFSADRTAGQLRVFLHEVRTFKIGVPVLVQEWDSSISNEASSGGAGGGGGAGGLGARVSLRTHSETKGLWDEIDRAMEQLVGKDGKTGDYSVNRVAGFATVRAPPSQMRAVAGYFEALNAEMERTVSVETKVLQVEFRDERSAGVDWTVLAQRLGSFGTLVDLTLPAGSLVPGDAPTLSFSGRGGQAFIKALEEQGDLRLLAQPTLVLGNNLPAIIEVGTVQSFVAEQTTTVSGQGGTAQTSVRTSSLSDGLILSILPRMLEGGEVSMGLALVAQDILEIRREPVGEGFIELPRTSRRSYGGVVRAKSGQSVVIGGLISDRKETRREGLPFLSRIPFVGWMFGQHQKRTVRSELVITITPLRPGTSALSPAETP